MTTNGNKPSADQDYMTAPEVEATIRRLMFNQAYEPYKRFDEHYGFPQSAREKIEQKCELGMPVPPEHILRRYSGGSQDYQVKLKYYLEGGRLNVKSMLDTMSNAGFPITNKMNILDFGCAAGRMLRWLNGLGESSGYWGVDVVGEDALWAQRYLAPKCKVLVATRFPHLPMRDGTFDFIYACSVFSHIDDLALTWLCELLRVCKPGGHLFLTVMDEHTIDELHNRRREHLERDVLANNSIHASVFDGYRRAEYEMFTIRRSQISSLKPESPQTFYRSDFIHRTWSLYADIVDYVPGAYGYQSAVVLRAR